MTYQKPSTFLWLKIGGEHVSDELSWSEMAGIDVSDAIPCYELNLSGAIRNSALKFAPVEFVKVTDRSSPLIASALVQNSQVEAEFHFFGLDPERSVDSHRFTLEIGGGRVRNFSQELRTDWWTGDGRPVLTDTVRITFTTCLWVHPNSGMQADYSWEERT